MAARFWVGGTGTWDASDTTHWAASSGGAGGQSVPGSGDTVTLDGSSGGGTVTVGASYDPNVTSITMGAFTGTLDFSANNNNPTMQTFNCSGTGTRTLNTGTGTWTVTGNNATIWTFSTATNLTVNGGCTVNFNYSGSTGTRTIIGSSAARTGVVNVTAGTDIVSMNNNYTTDLNFTGFTGTLTYVTNNPNLTGSLTYGTNMTVSSVSITPQFTATSGTKTITTNGVQCNHPININTSVGVTVNLADNLNMDGASVRTLTISQGIFDANGKNVTVGAVVSSNSATRTITMGSGTWTLTGNNLTVWNLGTITNLTFNRGSNAIVCNYSGATGTRTIGHTNTGESSCPSFNITAGTDIVNLSNTRVLNVDFTGFAGSLSTGTWLAWGNITLSATMTVSATTNGMSMVGTGASYTLTNNGVTIDRPFTFGGAGSGSTAYVLADHLIVGSTRTLTHSAGTLNANNKNVTTGLFDSSNTNTRALTMGSGTWTLSGTGTVWTTSTTTGLTMNAGTSVIKLTDTSASTKTIIGGGLTFYNLDWTAGGSGAIIIQSSNTWNNWIGVGAKTLTLTAGTTQTFTSFSATGSSGNVLTINSSSAGSQASVSKASGVVSANYLSLQDSNATGGATWYAGANSTNVSNNSGWIFTAPVTVRLGADTGMSAMNLNSLNIL